MNSEIALLLSERSRVAAQLCELRRSQLEMRQALASRDHQFDRLLPLYDREQALRSYLRQINDDIRAMSEAVS